MASMKQKNGEEPLPERDGEGPTLFQTQANMSTHPAFWKGKGDARILLRVLTPQECKAVPRAAALALFVAHPPSDDLLAGWLVTRSWEGTAIPSFPHGAGCSCCLPAQGMGRMLLRLVQERARGECPFFSSVNIVCPASEKRLLVSALCADSLLTGLYGLLPISGGFFCHS